MADLAWHKGFQFFDDSGNPLNAGTVNIYDATTTNVRTVYKDALAASPWTPPITLNSAGRLTDPIYVPTGSWKYIVKNSAGSTITTEDNIPGAITIPSASYAQPELPVITKATDYTATTSDLGSLIEADPTGGNITLTLPSAVAAGDGGTLWVQHVGTAGKITIVPSGAQTIDGGSSVVLIRPRACFVMVSDGAGWSSLGTDRAFGTLAKTADYTVSIVNHGRTVTVDASGAARTITLPAAASAGDGFEVTVVKIDSSANAVTIDGNATETINGALTLLLGAQWDSARLRCDGSGWLIARRSEFTSTATTLAADTNDWAPTGLSYSDIIRVAASAAYNVTGMTALGGGATRTVENVGTFNITFLGNNASSTAANRFLIPRPLVLRPSQAVVLKYDATSAGWRATSALPSTQIAAGFKNLKVLVTGNSAITVTADALTLEDANGEAHRAMTLSVTGIDLAVSGAGGLDTGAEASGTWYAVWIIYNPTTNVLAGLLSVSSTLGTITLPSGSTYAARVGWIRNDGSSNMLRTLQYGRSAQYVIGTNPTVAPTIANGVAGTYSVTSPVLAAVSVTGVVPTATATRINVLAQSSYHGGSQSAVLVAPNTSWGGSNNGPNGSNNQGWPLFISALGATGSGNFYFHINGWLVLEATTIAWAADAAGGGIACLGWEDNI